MVQHFTSLNGVNLENTWLTIGSFDGIHIGHKYLINELNQQAQLAGGRSVVLTFHPHPAVILRGRVGAFYLTTLDEKIELLDELGADFVITYPFTYELSQSTAREYLNYLKSHLGFLELWVGHDFALGKGREGNIPYLQEHSDEFGYKLHVVDPVVNNGRVVSSSLIRNLLHEGNVSEASILLARPYSISGEVVHGDGRGKTIGIPTANLETGPEKLIPAAGVYACRVKINDKYLPAAVNIGTRPTFETTDQKSHIEAYILDFHGEIYGQKLTLEFVERLRGEERYENVADLIKQIRIDIDQTRNLVSDYIIPYSSKFTEK
jgi:riboflavin kinase / FMN adenylyltransferase